MTGTPDAAPSPESIRRLRKEYALAGLSEADAAPDPFFQFRRWFDEALHAELREPNAMTVATATREGIPSARIVLLKSWDERGFVFYTNYEGQKGRELAENPAAALVFYWPEMERQVRIAGAVAQVSPEESDRYFASRPLGSRLGRSCRSRAASSPTARVWRCACSSSKPNIRRHCRAVRRGGAVIV